MKLKEYLDNINKLVEEDPSVLELTVVYSRDDEGNGYQEVHYEPGLGYHDGEYHGEMTFVEDFEDEWEDEEDKLTNEDINAICIN